MWTIARRMCVGLYEGAQRIRGNYAHGNCSNRRDVRSRTLSGYAVRRLLDRGYELTFQRAAIRGCHSDLRRRRLVIADARGRPSRRGHQDLQGHQVLRAPHHLHPAGHRLRAYLSRSGHLFRWSRSDR